MIYEPEFTMQFTMLEVIAGRVPDGVYEGETMRVTVKDGQVTVVEGLPWKDAFIYE